MSTTALPASTVARSVDLARDGGFKCAVCMEVFSAPVSISCGHTFCQYCIAVIVLSHAAKARGPQRRAVDGEDEDCGPRCPICREPIKCALEPNQAVRKAMISAEPWEADVKRLDVRLATVEERMNRVQRAEAFELVVQGDAIAADVVWGGQGGFRKGTITRLVGTWDRKTGKFEAKAVSTTWLSDTNAQWARYRPNHSRHAFPSMNISNGTEEKSVPWEKWTGTLSAVSDSGGTAWQLQKGEFRSMEERSAVGDGVLLMQIGSGVEKSFEKYVTETAPKEKRQDSYLSSFLAAPKKFKTSDGSGSGGLAFARLWAHSSPDPGSFSGETIKKNQAMPEKKAAIAEKSNPPAAVKQQASAAAN